MNPTQTCKLCGRAEYVIPDGRGFPPDIAKRKLVNVPYRPDLSVIQTYLFYTAPPRYSRDLMGNTMTDITPPVM